jgi:hypothetical protein
MVFSFLAVLAVPLGISAATENEVVTPSSLETQTNRFVAAENNSGKWFFYNDENDTINNTLGTFVDGPETPPAGEDSAEISVDGTERVNLATYRFSNTALADITELKFSTYNALDTNMAGEGSDRSGFLHFNVDFDGTDTWQRRLVFVPSLNGEVAQDEWQEWDAINGGAALWRYSGATWPGTTTPGTTPMTWSQILAQYPGISIRDTDAFLGVRVGEPYADGYTENIDKFVFGTAAQTTVFDFEQDPVRLANKDQCKEGGWRNSEDPVFKNQGDCVSSFASKGKAKGNPIQNFFNSLFD